MKSENVGQIQSTLRLLQVKTFSLSFSRQNLATIAAAFSSQSQPRMGKKRKARPSPVMGKHDLRGTRQEMAPATSQKLMLMKGYHDN